MNADSRMEIEFKFRVRTEEDFARLRKVLGASPEKSTHQVNYIFDTPDFALRSRSFSLRLREEAGRYTMTLKGPALAMGSGSELKDTLAARPEEECAIDGREAQELLEGRIPVRAVAERRLAGSSLLERIAAGLSGSELVCLGSFENDRERIGPIPLLLGGEALELTYELDRTHFPGGVLDREVEVEVGSLQNSSILGALGEFVRSQLAQAGVRWTLSTSKVARFYECLGAT